MSSNAAKTSRRTTNVIVPSLKNVRPPLPRVFDVSTTANPLFLWADQRSGFDQQSNARITRGRRSRHQLGASPAPADGSCGRSAAAASCKTLRRLRTSLQPGTYGCQHRFWARVQETVARVRVLTIDGHPEFTKSPALLLDPRPRSCELRRHPGGDGCPHGSDRTAMHHYSRFTAPRRAEPANVLARPWSRILDRVAAFDGVADALAAHPHRADAHLPSANLDGRSRILEKRPIPPRRLERPRAHEHAPVHHNRPDTDEAVTRAAPGAEFLV